MKSFTHLSLDDRIQIQSCLGSHLSFKKIAALIHRDCTTISKEVRNHRTVVNSPRPYGKNNNRCQYATSCDRHHVCCRCTARRDERCSRCRVQNCNSVCPDFLENHCARLSRAPYVCNGCPIRNRCPLEKQFYYARDADAEYSRTLSDSRKGVDLTQAEIDDLNRLLQACIGKNKQSPYHVYISHRDMFNCSLRTLYNYINLGILNVKPIDLPRATRRKPRKTKSRTHKVDARCREGRSYTDYLSYMEKHPNSRVCQLDSVIGRKGGSCILTLCFPDIRFQFGYLRKRNDARSVRDFLSSSIILWIMTCFINCLMCFLSITAGNSAILPPLKLWEVRRSIPVSFTVIPTVRIRKAPVKTITSILEGSFPREPTWMDSIRNSSTAFLVKSTISAGSL